ncbi:hypothetical protein BSKO_13064 [Bryopsis sp. KO-2023]|nr:hypothetical protein BSKO_13064 [Bryopsis sp. KO-2023]
MANNRCFRNEVSVFGAIGKGDAASYCQHLGPVAITPRNPWENLDKSKVSHAWGSYMDLTAPPLDNDFEVVGLLNEKTDIAASNKIGVKLSEDGLDGGGVTGKGPKHKRMDRKSSKKKTSMLKDGWKGSKKGFGETERKKMDNKIASQALRLTGQQQTISALNETIRKQRSTMAVMQGALSDKSRELDRTQLTVRPAAPPADQAIKEALKIAKKREGEIMERLDGLERQISALSADGTQNQRRLNCLVRSVKTMSNVEKETVEKTEDEKRTTKKIGNGPQAEKKSCSKDATLRRVFNLQTFLRKEKEEREKAQKDLEVEKEHTKRLCEKLDEVEDAWKETAQVIEKTENEKELLAKAEYDIRMCEVDNARVTRELKKAREKAKLMDEENADLKQKMTELERQIDGLKIGLGIDERKKLTSSCQQADVSIPEAKTTENSHSSSSKKKPVTRDAPASKGTWKSLVSSHRELMKRLEEVEKTAIATSERWSSSRSKSRGCSKGTPSNASTSINNQPKPATSTPTLSSQPPTISEFPRDRKSSIAESPTSKKSSPSKSTTSTAARKIAFDVPDDSTTSLDERRHSPPPSPARSVLTFWDGSCDINLRESVNETSTVKGGCPSRAESVTMKIPGLLEAQRRRYAASPAEIFSGSDVESESRSGGPPSEGMSEWMETHDSQKAARRNSRGSSRGLNKRRGSVAKLRNEYVRSKEIESRCRRSKT